MERILSLNNSLIRSNLSSVKREILFTVDINYIIPDIDPEVIHLLGYSHKDMIGISYNKFLSYENPNFAFPILPLPTNNITLSLKCKNNKSIYVDVNYVLILDSNNETVGIYCSMMNISKFRATEQRLNMIDSLLDNSKDIIYNYHFIPERKFLYLSKSLESVFDYTIARNYQNPMFVFQTAHPDDILELEKNASGKADYSKSIITRWKQQDGTYLSMEDYPIPVYDYNVNFTGVQGICRDVSEKVRLEKKLNFLLSHDDFTGLRNRTYFDEELKRYNDIENIPIGIIIGDLDNLKVINDSLGHDKGDLLIKKTSDLLSKLSSSIIILS